jgi:hypothetical protein
MHGGSGGVAARISNFGKEWRWAFSLRPSPLYHLGRNPVLLEKELGEPNTWSSKEKIFAGTKN